MLDLFQILFLLVTIIASSFPKEIIRDVTYNTVDIGYNDDILDVVIILLGKFKHIFSHLYIHILTPFDEF